jgi:hypothetical protein
MKYLCLVYLAKDRWDACPDHVCARYGQELSERGVLLAAEPLHPVERAATVRVRDGEVLVHDGPFAETKEQLAGFYLVDAAKRDEALEIAAKIPPARVGCVEVRPIRQLKP